MYKRRARVHFQHSQRPEIAQWAAELAEQIGGDWLEAQHTDLDPTWPDLLILLDGSPADKPQLPRPVTIKIWELGPDWKDRLTGKIQGMLGGLRLLARLDQSEAPRQ
ncbi:MAG: hypothetical protein K0041_05140 [Acidithiobacillus sp.]|nr:hypothetical protein [Acidithiobacillus sp.]